MNRDKEAFLLFKSAGICDEEGYFRVNEFLWVKIDTTIADDAFSLTDLELNKKLFEFELPTQQECLLIMNKIESIFDFYRLTNSDVWEWIIDNYASKSFNILNNFTINIDEIVFLVKRL
jgi:hypothetical protein